MTEPVFGPPPGLASRPPVDAPPEPRGVRTRIAAGVGVGLMGAASLSTAVYQSITQASTTVGMPGTVAEVDTPLPWGTPVAAPAATGPAITPTVADLDLRADRQALPAPVAPAADGVPAPGPALDGAPAPRPERVTATGERGPGTSGTPSGTTRPTTPPSSTPPGSGDPSTDPSPSPTTEDEAPEPTPEPSPSQEPTPEPSSSDTPSAEPTPGSPGG